jgi:hypothetical protein
LTESLANDLGGVHEVIQDGVVDSSQGTASGTGLLTVVAATRNRQDAALGNENNVAVRELLFEFTGKPSFPVI